MFTGIVVSGCDEGKLHFFSVDSGDDVSRISTQSPVRTELDTGVMITSSVSATQTQSETSTVVGCRDGVLRICSKKKGKSEELFVNATLLGHSARLYIEGLDCWRKKKLIASSSNDGTVRLWKLNNIYQDERRKEEKCIHSFDDYGGDCIYCVKFLKRIGSNLIGSSSYGGEIVFHDFEKLKMTKKLEAYHDEYIETIDFGENLLISCSADKSVKVLDLRNYKEVASRKFEKGLYSVLCLDDVHEVVVGDNHEGKLFVVDLRNLKNVLKTWKAHESSVNRIISMMDQNLICSCEEKVKIWDRSNNFNQRLGFEVVKKDGNLNGLNYFPESYDEMTKQEREDLEFRVQFLSNRIESTEKGQSTKYFYRIQFRASSKSFVFWKVFFVV